MLLADKTPLILKHSCPRHPRIGPLLYNLLLFNQPPNRPSYHHRPIIHSPPKFIFVHGAYLFPQQRYGRGHDHHHSPNLLLICKGILLLHNKIQYYFCLPVSSFDRWCLLICYYKVRNNYKTIVIRVIIRTPITGICHHYPPEPNDDKPNNAPNKQVELLLMWKSVSELLARLPLNRYEETNGVTRSCVWQKNNLIKYINLILPFASPKTEKIPCHLATEIQENRSSRDETRRW